jgi:hypothetical protein
MSEPQKYYFSQITTTQIVAADHVARKTFCAILINLIGIVNVVVFPNVLFLKKKN